MNNDLKLEAAGRGVRLWEVAAKMGLADATLSRKLRFKLSPDDRERFLTAVDEIAREKRSAANV